jgi:hypothetical protein
MGSGAVLDVQMMMASRLVGRGMMTEGNYAVRVLGIHIGGGIQQILKSGDWQLRKNTTRREWKV